ncbi:ATP-dependent RNA helicase HrpA [Suttonella sp. R2A3]|uniref:ATP-dependent RNA helicase HrpA n=1 Tax=Suttonella sp. R2A3 TaxID=2908648 RepID=UPI001F1E7F0B|nr:ATP-dependent RNA helicase HrpA [Suttonella sp. R2A3]UJF24332.1 ATP-dependent RNA helicase HrpA [Suttonella sp. R2A3]
MSFDQLCIDKIEPVQSSWTVAIRAKSAIIPRMNPDLDTVLSTDRHGLASLSDRIAQRQQRGQPVDRMQAKFDALYERSHATYQKRLNTLPKPSLDADLPVLAEKDTLKRLIADNQVVIISGETGSGKTTQLPQLCLDLGLGARGLIGHTQPRQIAARSVAARIAEELSVPLGGVVGYQVRFDEKTSDDTVIKLMTDGMLLAETLSDPFLSRYEVIIVDEAHERSLNIDFLLGYLHQLLTKRPDLKLIITSATIDADKFATHFNHAPQINVSGRTYPVSIRYREPEPDSDMSRAIVDAVDELDSEGRGDVLVFLPTERDIRETAKALNQAELRDSDILPLFGRLSLADQQAVFHPKARRRIVLATNVAETSLTVPRIKYVIDTGTARISRYSLRTKTQRLPIEAISQASANQRAGRCGRVSAGVCIRLYTEEDFNARPEFTEPEILRTNLAAVILQMLTLRLGEVADFPFVDPPDQRQINDGYRLLFELKAVDEGNRLTPLGKRMAQLPIDPRFARMVFAAETNGCLHEALIVLAALSIQDPRERPFGQEAQADMRQAVFVDKKSDFQSLLNLFAAYQRARRKLSNNKLRGWCKSYFLNALRMREWRELVNQLLREVHQQKLRVNELKPPQPRNALTEIAEGTKGSLGYDNPHLETLHRSLLSGLLDQVGLWDEQNSDYSGPRGRKFVIFPGSVLAKNKPQAVMAANIVEINRTFARTCAPIELHELETLAAHLTKTQYANPHWSKKAGNVMAHESVLLYGLPIVAERQKPFAGQDAALAHEIFVQEALVTGEIRTRVKAIEANRALLAELEVREEKTRSRGIIIDEQAMADFYFQRLPESVHSVVSFEQWVKKNGESSLRMQDSDLLLDDSALSKQDYPEYLHVHGHKLALEYAFDPGGHADGITVLVPITALNALDERTFERLVPAMLEEKIAALMRRLPKLWRRQLVPIPDFARAVHERLNEDQGDEGLVEAIRRHIAQIKGVNIPDDAFDEAKIDAHYRMNYRVIDANKRSLGEGRDLALLQEELGERAAQQFNRRSRSTLADSDTEIHEWQWDKLPTQERMKGGIIGYPALSVDGESVYLRLHDDPERAEVAHREGVRALLKQKLHSQIKYLKKNLPQFTTMSLHYRKISNDTHLLDDIIQALIERVCLPGEAPRSKQAFAKVLADGEQHLVRSANELARQLADLLAEYSRINERLRRVKHKSAKTDIQSQLERLVFPGFIRQTPAARLPDVARYLKAINVRLDKLEREPLKDASRQQSISPWDDKLNAWLTSLNIDRPHESCKQAKQQIALIGYFYTLEEYRIQTFAQEIGTKGKVSEKALAAFF